MKKEFGARTVEAPQDSGAIYNVECTASADILLEEGLTLAEAQILVEAYEEEDRKNGEYTDGFYSIRNTKTDEVETVHNSYADKEPEKEPEYYYWLDTSESWNAELKGEMLLIRGEWNKDGEKNRNSEEAILKFSESDCGIAEEEEIAWDKVDAYIEKALGFIPDYEVN